MDSATPELGPRESSDMKPKSVWATLRGLEIIANIPINEGPLRRRENPVLSSKPIRGAKEFFYRHFGIQYAEHVITVDPNFKERRFSLQPR